MNHYYGYVAYHYFNRQLPLTILSLGFDNYFIGTCDEDGLVSRESIEYFANYDLAMRAFYSGMWTQKEKP